jgi:hypothetical protein
MEGVIFKSFVTVLVECREDLEVPVLLAGSFHSYNFLPKTY